MWTALATRPLSRNVDKLDGGRGTVTPFTGKMQGLCAVILRLKKLATTTAEELTRDYARKLQYVLYLENHNTLTSPVFFFLCVGPENWTFCCKSFGENFAIAFHQYNLGSIPASMPWVGWICWSCVCSGRLFPRCFGFSLTTKRRLIWFAVISFDL